VKFDIVGTIAKVETIAAGPSVKVRSFLQKSYGRGRWRKLKGIATVRLPNGKLRRVELHWYEAHGIGKEISRSRVTWTNNEATYETVCVVHR